MSDPNCVVDVRFDEVSGKFSYSCSNSSRGWQVFPDGSIYPAYLGRVVQFRIKNDSGTAIDKIVKIAGFQIAADGFDAVPPADHFLQLPVGSTGEALVCAKSPVPYPPVEDTATFTELTFDLGVHRWFYRLAVVLGDSQPIWDDPRIHDDGSE